MSSHQFRTVLVVISVLVIFGFSAWLDYQRVVEYNRASLTHELTALKGELETQINSRVLSLQGVTAYIQKSPDATETEIERYLGELYDSTDEVLRNVAILKNTTIIYSYPKARNAAAIGKDLANVPGQRETVLRVKYTGKGMITGPINLVQGGTGLVARVPVILKGGAYWGQVSVVLYYDKLMQTSGVTDFSLRNNLMIAEKGTDQNTPRTVWNSVNGTFKNPVVVELIVPNTTWVISAEPRKGWSGKSVSFYTLMVLGIIFSGLSGRYYHVLMSTQENLEKSESKFRTLFASSPDANLLLINGLIIDSNSAARLLLHTDELHLHGKSLLMISPEKQPDGETSKFKLKHIFNATLPDEGIKFEWLHRRDDGSEFWSETVVTSLKIQNNKVLYTTLRDITQRKIAEQELQKINTRLGLISKVSSSLVGSSPVVEQVDQYARLIRDAFNIDVSVVRVLDGDDLVLLTCSGVDKEMLTPRVSPRWGLTKILMEEKKPVTVYDLHTDTRTMHNHFFVPNTYQARCYAGAPLLIRDECIGLLGIYLNNDNRHFSETDLEHLQIIANNIAIVIENDMLYKDLSKKKIQVESELVERRRIEQELLTAKEKAEEINRLKTSFFSNMSHELRTPLMGILGYSQVLLNALEDEYLKRMAQTIVISGQRLSHTVKLILDITKLDSERVLPEYQLVDVTRLIEESIQLHEKLALSKLLSLSFEDPGYPIPVFADRNWCVEAFNNVINNAIKFTNKGTVKVIAFREETNAYIQIIDTGIGIAESDQQVIFEEFRQASEGLSRSYEGTGLGLTIAKRYIEMMHGQIYVESILGKGSTFTIVLPISEDASLFGPGISETESETRNKSTMSSKKVLVIENDAINIDVITSFLKNSYPFDVEKTAEGGLSKVLQGSYDVVLLDINLGRGMDGLQVVDEMKRVWGEISIPVVAMTAYAMDGDKEKFIEAGCTHYLAKPFRKSELLNFLAQIFIEWKK
ncbi:MAG: ATP-binding protein [Ignavibacteria bacterium]|nr:ATP-binding protein [Ignavibacteria bacterium]